MTYICIWVEQAGPQGQRVPSIMTGLSVRERSEPISGNQWRWWKREKRGGMREEEGMKCPTQYGQLRQEARRETRESVGV